MHTSLSSYCLEHMGIQVWQLRDLLPGAAPAGFQTYGLFGLENGESHGILHLEFLPMQAAQIMLSFRLLDAMLAAVHLRRAPVVEEATAFVLVMGQNLAKDFLGSQVASFDELRVGNIYNRDNGEKLLVTYHPLDLLNNPANKAKAWEDLKKLRG